VEIDINNCPERLRHFLFGINELLEGRGEKIQRDVENEVPTVDTTSPEYMEQMKSLFAHAHVAAKSEKEAEKSLEGKTHRDIEIGSRFGGNVEEGKEAFARISRAVSGSHDAGFNFFPQQGQKSNNPRSRTNSEVIRDVRQNSRN